MTTQNTIAATKFSTDSITITESLPTYEMISSINYIGLFQLKHAYAKMTTTNLVHSVREPVAETSWVQPRRCWKTFIATLV